LLDTPKPSATGASSTATLTPASGRRVVSAEGAFGGKRSTTSPPTSGSESNTSNGKSGSGSSGTGKKSSGGSSSGLKKTGARSPPPRGGLGLVFAQQQQQQGGTRNLGSPVVPPPMSPSSMAAAGAEGDDIYQAFVKQWCFASAPSPAQSGGFGRKGV
jgi:hypothetical protein